jgi:predicted transcriptional regulator
MNTDKLTQLIERARTWPEWKQEELLRVADHIEAESDEVYEPTPEELEGIDRGLAAADTGDFATDEELAAVFARHRNKRAG